MKKVLSSIIVACMLLTCIAAIGVSAADAGMIAYVVENETTVDVTVKLAGPLNEVNGIKTYVVYDATALTYNGDAAKGKDVAALSEQIKALIPSGATGVKVDLATTTVENMVTIAEGTEITVATMSFAKIGEVKAETISLTTGIKDGLKAGYTTVGIRSNATHKKADVDPAFFTVDFTPYAPVVEDKVVTFEKVYSEGKTAVVFGKALEGAVEAGVYFAKDGAALEHSTAMAKTEKGAGYFPAYKSDITKAFGVQIQDLEAGDYAAKVYSDDAFGSEVTFAIQ